MKILIAGGRNFGSIPKGTSLDDMERARALAHSQQILIRDTLDTMYGAAGRLIVVHGKCPTGADYHGDRWARARGHEIRPYPANWSRDKRAAGPIRNRFMLNSEINGLAEGVFFPDRTPAGEMSPGTSDMIRLMQAAGLPTHIFEL